MFITRLPGEEKYLQRIESWIRGLANEGLNVQDLPKTSDGKRRCLVQLSHNFLPSYEVEVVFHGSTVSFAAGLLDKVSLPVSREIYQFALELNSLLNTAHIAVVDGRLVLMHSFIVKEFTERWVYRDLANFNDAHEYTLTKIIEKARELKVA